VATENTAAVLFVGLALPMEPPSLLLTTPPSRGSSVGGDSEGTIPWHMLHHEERSGLEVTGVVTRVISQSQALFAYKPEGIAVALPSFLAVLPPRNAPHPQGATPASRTGAKPQFTAAEKPPASSTAYQR